jgi:hypothetical protein
MGQPGAGEGAQHTPRLQVGRHVTHPVGSV